MNYTHLTLSIVLVAGNSYCSDKANDPFKAGKVYDKDGSSIYIERPWLKPKDLIIRKYLAIPRAKTNLCLTSAMICFMGACTITYDTLLDKEKFNEPGYTIFRAFATIGLGLASVWFTRKTLALNKVERDGIEPAQKAADDLWGKVSLARFRFNNVTIIEHKGFELLPIFTK